jgi:hypothetical protein
MSAVACGAICAPVKERFGQRAKILYAGIAQHFAFLAAAGQTMCCARYEAAAPNCFDEGKSWPAAGTIKGLAKKA